MFKPVIVGYARSPFTMARKGALIDVKPVNLLSEVIKNLVSKLISSLASKFRKPKIVKTNKLANAKDNLFKNVIKENKIPEISSLNLLRWISLTSA